MAHLDELVGEIRNATLRKKMQSALADLKRRQRFGLVFEEHVPETACLLGLPLQEGALVQRRDDPEGRSLYTVTKLTARTASIEPVNGGESERVRHGDVIVVKRFGDPIYASLSSVGVLRRGSSDRSHHAVINGENFHALQLFRFMYEGKVDCIYIDPPYNTGARDWKYNNRYVDSNDSWRHSKWLSMMEKRLRLAKRLLKSDGVLICTIDEHELHHLGMLLEKVFPEYLHYMITMAINPKGREKANFAPVGECALFVVPDVGYDIIQRAPSGPSVQGTLFDKDDDGNGEKVEGADASEDEGVSDAASSEPEWEIRHARRRGGGAESSSYREKRPNQFYPIYIDENERNVVRAGESIPLDKKPSFRKSKGLRPIWPIDTEGRHRCWAFIPASMQKMIDQGDVLLGKYHAKRDDWTINYRVPKKTTRKLKTMWWEKRHDAGTHGTELLKKYLGQPGLFPFPKSVYAVKDCLAAVVRDRPNALILDFFAGSGTTLHATCLLNLEDDGNRRSVIVTNNEVEESLVKKFSKEGVFRGDPLFEEHGIFNAVTRPRCEATIIGKRADGTVVPGRHLDARDKAKGRPHGDGFSENVEFFQLDYLDPDDVDLGNQFDAILPALWLASGGIGDRDAGTNRKWFSMPEGSTYGVLFRESRFHRFMKALIDRPDVTHVWLVTDSEEAYAEMRSALPKRIHASMLYRDYLRNFRINTRQSL